MAKNDKIKVDEKEQKAQQQVQNDRASQQRQMRLEKQIWCRNRFGARQR